MASKARAGHQTVEISTSGKEHRKYRMLDVSNWGGIGHQSDASDKLTDRTAQRLGSKAAKELLLKEPNSSRPSSRTPTPRPSRTPPAPSPGERDLMGQDLRKRIASPARNPEASPARNPEARYTSEQRYDPLGQEGKQASSLISRRADNEIVFRRKEKFDLKGSLEELLAEQRIAVERALAFNTEIAERLAKEVRLSPRRGNSEEAGTGDRLSESNRQQVSFSAASPDTKSESTLSQPLLTKQESNVSVSTSSPKLVRRLSMKVRTESQTSNSIMEGMSTHMFPALVDLKKQIEANLNEPSYRAEDNYKEDGFWVNLALSGWFQHLTLFVILLNTLWIAIDTDYNKADLLVEADTIFQVIDNIFCMFFSIEMIIRFNSFKATIYALVDPGFMFDLFLVLLMVWETWVMTLFFMCGYNATGGGKRAVSVLRIFRTFRLLRVARTARLFGSVPELMILAKGMAIATRSVFVVLSLLALIIYIFSIMFTQLLSAKRFNESAGGNPFTSVPESANFLMLQVLCGFDPDFAVSLLAANPICYILFLVYLLTGSLTIMNMLIGILCDVVFTVADSEKEAAAEREMESKVVSVAESLDVGNSGAIHRADFDQVMKNPKVIFGLHDLGVDVPGLVDFANFVFQENEEISYTNFQHMVFQFRGKAATVKDLMNMRKQMSTQLLTILDEMELATGPLKQLPDQLDKLSNQITKSREVSKTATTQGDIAKAPSIKEDKFKIKTVKEDKVAQEDKFNKYKMARDYDAPSEDKPEPPSGALTPSTSETYQTLRNWARG